jgi:antitoxin ParD1/3/4
MKPTGESNSFVLPPALLAEVEAAADAEHRPVADVVRELVEQGLSERRWKAHSEEELRLARELGLPDADGQPMSDEYRQTIREKIAQGMQSVREGRVTDGEAFMAKMNAELAALERQGQ